MWVYCTKEDVSDFCGVATSDMKDSWSRIVEGLIDEHTGSRFDAVHTYTEAYDGDGTNTLILNNAPIVSVTSVSIDDVALQSSDYVVYSSGYIRLVSSNYGALDRALGSGSVFPVGRQNIDVVYTANAATVPAYVQLAAILAISELALISRRGGADGSLAVSRATQRAGEDNRTNRRSVDISGRLRTIIRNTIGEKWRYA